MQQNKVNYSKPTKESYQSDIRDSRHEDKTHLAYEFFDDYTYEGSKHILFHIKPYKGKYYLYASMEHGPQDSETLNKLVEWKISGEKSLSETGHQGGGNCRFIYGQDGTEKVILHSMVNDEEFIRLETSPQKIYESSNDKEVSEKDFRDLVDRGNFIKWSNENLDYEEESAWFQKYRDEIFEETNLNINYLIRFTLPSLPVDYNDKNHWEHFKIRMKNYKIPIYFKNEIVEETEFIKNEPLDLIGLDEKNHEKDSLKHFELLIDSDENYYIKVKGGNEIRNAGGEIVQYNEGMVTYANAKCYRINKKHYAGEIKKLNEISNEISKKIRKYTQEDFYGIYIWMNEKVISFLPINDILQPSKQFAEGGNSQFRIILEPIVENDILNSLIITNTVKAKTTFRNKNKIKTIMKTLQNMYIGKDALVKNVTKKVTERKTGGNIIKGGIYLGYHYAGLYKIGMVEEYKSLNRRTQEHKKKTKEMVKKFVDKETDDENFTIYYEGEVKNPELIESQIKEYLKTVQDENPNKITLYNCENGNSTREYFKCDDQDYIISTIIPHISELQ